MEIKYIPMFFKIWPGMLDLNNFKLISDYENCKNFREIWLILSIFRKRKQYDASRNLEKLILNFVHSFPM